MPSLGIAPRPGGCAGRERMPAQDAAPVPGVFPADGYLHFLEIRVQAAWLSPYCVNRAARCSVRLDTAAAFLACSFPLLSFRTPVSHPIQEQSSESFPTPSGIQQGATRRSLTISRGSRSTPSQRMGTATAFLACYCPLRLSAPGKPSDPGISSEFLPAEPGIQQDASRRSHVLVHIDRGDPVIQHSHAPPPEAA